MKIFAFQLHQPQPGVRIAVETAIETSFDAIERHVAMLGPRIEDPLDPILGITGPTERSFPGSAGPPFRFRIGPIAFRDSAQGAVQRTERGFVTYASIRDLLTFLRERWEPTLDTGLDGLVRRAQSEGWSPDVARRIEGLVIAASDRFTRPGVRDEGVPIHFVGATERLFETWERAEGTFLLPQSHDDEVLVAARRSVEVEGHSVPRIAFVVKSLRNPGPVIAWDGKRFHTAAEVGELPVTLLRRLEARGSCMRGSTVDLAPATHVTPAFLLRLPTREEAQAARGSRVARLPTALERPAFLTDTLRPIRLPRDLPVIDDPRTAIHVLGCTARRIYVPGPVRAAPSKGAPAIERLREEPVWAVGVRIGGAGAPGAEVRP